MNMERTLGTISTEKGLARLVHCDQTGRLIAWYANGQTEDVGDYSATKSWRKARRHVIGWYSNTIALHDTWVLCLRPILALQISKSEDRWT